MRAWQVQDAKARFSEMLETCQGEGPQMVTRRGVETAVLVPVEEWRRIEGATRRPTLKELLLADEPRFDLPIPERHRPVRRRTPRFG